MQSTHKWQRASIAAALVLVFAAIAACTEVMRPSETLPDSWAEQALVSMHVRTELTSLGIGQAKTVGTTMDLTTMVVFADRPSHGPEVDRVTMKGRNVAVRHFRDRHGRIHSVAAVDDGTHGPPKLVYTFENGRIQTIVSSVYDQRGEGWIRRHTRITYFDSTGRPRLQSESRPLQSVQSAQGRGLLALANVPRDILAATAALALPAELHAEEVGCLSEWLAYASAGLALASASTALTAAIGACTTGGPIAAAAACPTVEPLLVAWGTTLTAWNFALDKLLLCEAKQPSPVTGDGGGGGTDGTNTDDADNGDDFAGGGGGADDYASITKTVTEFIDDAIAEGNFYCSEDGTYCIYYALE